jgi:hypothetical protein
MKIYSNRGQGVMLVLYSLRELGGVCSKQEVLSFIQNADLYEIDRHDFPPYPGQNEPRYHTLLAWARKDALIEKWLVDTTERDAWQLSRPGREVLDRTFTRYQNGSLTVRKCYLWTRKFKKLVDPNYEPSDEDAIRPEDAISDYE